MTFEQWIQQAYGVHPDDATARFTVYNMQVAFQAGKDTDGNRVQQALDYQSKVVETSGAQNMRLLDEILTMKQEKK